MFERLEADEALRRGRELPYALIRSLSCVTLGPVPKAVDLAELLEARFFDGDQEIRIFRGETGLQAARLWEEEEPVIDRTYRLAGSLFGQSVTVRRILTFDDDGQARVCATRLAGWKGENENAANH